MELLLGLALILSGLLAGICAGGSIHDRRIVDLSAAQYAAMHQMRDKTFRRVMPVLGLATLAFTVGAATIALPWGTPRLLGAVAALATAIDIAHAVLLQLPLNRQVQAWTSATIPGNWAAVRDRWALQHGARTLLAVTAFTCLVAAALLARW